ncbi:hypothetical protein CIT26_16565 [Mesorhizobium temperatum]|uniref:Uncharacterized protein n=1 Tax=Mesorhizobium temperatum TaxID=241416 RepID=A0A271LKA0_9HYPH|nr:hypothetical protein CIT26_16565 [Mesorhizobium temperatum]
MDTNRADVILAIRRALGSTRPHPAEPRWLRGHRGVADRVPHQSQIDVECPLLESKHSGGFAVAAPKDHAMAAAIVRLVSGNDR